MTLINNLFTGGKKGLDQEALRKAKCLSIFQLAFILAAPLLGLFYSRLGAYSLFYVTIVASLLMVVSVILLRITRNLGLAGNFAIFVFWGTLLMLAWHTGGVTREGVIHPLWLMNGGVILLAMFLNGYVGGTVWATIVFAEMGLVVHRFPSDRFLSPIPPEMTAVYALGSFLLSLLVILLFTFLFESEKNRAISREQGKSAALRESKHYIDGILERSPVPMFILDRNHRVIQWNHACRGLTDVSAGAVLGKTVWEGFKVDDRGSLADIILEDPNLILTHYGDHVVSKSDDGWFELEMFLPHLKGGLNALVTVATISDNIGEVRGAIEIIQEIKSPPTDIAHLESEILGHPDEASAYPVIKIDSKGKVSFCNRACEEILGYASSQLVGMNALSFVSKPQRNEFRETIMSVYQGESFNRKDWKYVNSRGEPVYVLARAYLSRSSDGKAKECVLIHTDITALKLKLRELGLYAAESKERLKSLTEEHNLLRKNIATFIRQKERPQDDRSQKPGINKE
jgi:PAS domain S-box-containing protein